MIYYLTEMNLLKLKYTILKFLHDQTADQKLTTGVTVKVSDMMNKKHIDYYYADEVATATNVKIKFINNIYLKGVSYDKSLTTLLNECDFYFGTLTEANKLEKEINEILNTKKPIKIKRVFKRC